MSVERVVSRQEKVADSLSKLSEREKIQLEKASDGKFLGGDALPDPLRSKAVDLELAYRSSGRLKPDVYKMFQGDVALMVKR